MAQFYEIDFVAEDSFGQHDPYSYDLTPYPHLYLPSTLDSPEYFAEYASLLPTTNHHQYQDENWMELDSSPKPPTEVLSPQVPSPDPQSPTVPVKVEILPQPQPRQKYYELDPEKIADPAMKRKVEKAKKSRSYREKMKHDAARVECLGLCRYGKTLAEVFENLGNRARGDPVAEELLKELMEQEAFIQHAMVPLYISNISITSSDVL